jgi:predicted  nucleic acid-binding Zn-ribbon protein
MSEYKLLGIDEMPEAFGFVKEFRENPQVTEIIAGFKAELESIKKDNANLIEMNFNLEQQVSALKEDLEEANDQCLEWSDKYEDAMAEIEELQSALRQIRDVTESV